MHALLCQLDRISNDSLWLCLVGVTAQFLQSHISQTSYAACYNEIAEKVDNLNVQGDEVKPGTIQHSCEPRFLLHRFWSLYESMVSSDYVVAALKLNRTASTLSSIVACRCGTSERAVNTCGCVTEGQQGAVGSEMSVRCRYQYLSLKTRNELSTRLMGVSEEFHLQDLYYDSFTRRYGRECE